MPVTSQPGQCQQYWMEWEPWPVCQVVVTHRFKLSSGFWNPDNWLISTYLLKWEMVKKMFPTRATEILGSFWIFYELIFVEVSELDYIVWFIIASLSQFVSSFVCVKVLSTFVIHQLSTEFFDWLTWWVGTIILFLFLRTQDWKFTLKFMMVLLLLCRFRILKHIARVLLLCRFNGGP